MPVAPADARDAGHLESSIFRRPVMGDLRSKLRAKISRRHSGIPALPSARTGTESSHSNRSVEPGSPTSGTARARDAETGPAAAAEPGSSSSQHGHESGPVPDGETTPGALVRQDAKQGDAENSPAVAADADGGGGIRAAISGGGAQGNPPDPSKAAENDTNNRRSLPSPASAAPSASEGHGPSANDRPIPPPAAEISSDKKKTADPGHDQQLPSPARPSPRNNPRVSTDAARRIALSDTPTTASDAASSSDAASTDPRSAGPARVTAARRQQESPDPASAKAQSRPPGSATPRPNAPPRRQSLLPNRQTTLIRTLLDAGQPDELDRGASDQLLPISANMVTRKLWVRRPGASATLVTVNEEDLVDDVRELILRKYANSLGRHYDAPDLTLRIVPREGQRQERVLGPEEPMARTLDAYFPGGQTVDEALLIDVPHRRTPRASPRSGPPHAQHMTSVNYDEIRPLEASTDYFGPGAVAHIPVTLAGAANGAPHAISVLNTGQVPQVPSPGGTARTRQYRERPDRPRLGRQHTSSPTILNVVGAGGHTATIAVATNHGMQQASSNPRSRTHSNASSEQANAGPQQPPPPPQHQQQQQQQQQQQHPGAPPPPPPPPALPTPPTQDSAAAAGPAPRTATPPPPRPASPRPQPAARPKKKKTVDTPTLPAGMLNGGVPPINVLIVEDNIINLRLLEAFVKRLKVRWQTAMNGRDAVTKWRAGGFHLVLMDIQLPVMSGLEATREIRRLERMNSIGAFSTANNASGGAGGAADDGKKETPEEDKLPNRAMFKSPVIIVALTASSLQSDRHEALAAGCNDFLTKPVTYVWLERKVMEWGCMQALIDYDGWRKWKSYSQKPEAEEAPAKKTKAKKIRAAPNSSSSDQ